MSGPAAPDFIRYLAAKQGLDDRSLNRQVWDHLVRAVRDRPGRIPSPGPGSGLRHRHHAGAAAGSGFADPGGLHRHRCGAGVHPGGRRALPAVMRRRARPSLTVEPGGAMALLDPDPGNPGNV